MIEEGLRQMAEDSRKQLAKKHSDYRVFGFHHIMEFGEMDEKLKKLVQKEPSTTHVMLLKFANNNSPEKGIRLAVLQYEVREDSAAFKRLDEPKLTDELRKKLDNCFRKDGEEKRTTIEKALRVLRRRRN